MLSVALPCKTAGRESVLAPPMQPIVLKRPHHRRNPWTVVLFVVGLPVSCPHRAALHDFLAFHAYPHGAA